MTETLRRRDLPAVGQPPHRGQRRHRQDLDDRRAVPAAGAGPWRRAAASARPLVPAEILVMTFTRAATRELSDRIRARLLEAARCFRGEAVPADRRHACWPSCWRPIRPARRARGAAWRLAMAAESMDDAAVHTIDAWCQRMLREHAFDSGCLFDEELAANESAMLAEAARDYWRQQVYPLRRARRWTSRSRCGRTSMRWRRDAQAAASTSELPRGRGRGQSGRLHRAAVCASAAPTLAALKARLGRARARDAGVARRPATTTRTCPFDKAQADEEALHRLARRAGRLGRRSAGRIARPEAPAPRASRRAACTTALKPGAGVDAAAALRRLRATDAGAGRACRRWRRRCACTPPPASSGAWRELKQQAGTFGFADMLRRLDQALDAAHNGASAERLRERILAQYPVALIDEFQDTSPRAVAHLRPPLPHRGQRPRHRAAADRRPQAVDLRLSRRRHPQLSRRAPRHRRAATTCWAPTTARRRRWWPR